MSNKTCYAITRNGKPFWVVDSLADAKLELGSASVLTSADSPSGWEEGTKIGELVWLDPYHNRLSVRRVTPQHAGRIRAAATRRWNLRWFAHLAKIGLADCYPPCAGKGWNN